MIKTLSGSNSFVLKAELDRLVGDFIKEHGDMAVERIDGEEADHARITDAITNLPFLSSHKLVVLKNLSGQKQFVEDFEELLERIPETVEVVIVEPKPDKRSRYYKQLQKLTEFRSFEELGPQELPKWLVDEAKQRDGTLSARDAAYLVDRVGPNQQLLATELEKLVIYNPHITRETIDSLTTATPQSSTFDLMNAAFSGNHKQVLEIYQEQRQQKVEPQVIVGLLAWQLHVLALIKSADRKSPGEVAKEAKLNPFVVNKSAGLARTVSMGRIKSLVRDLTELDRRTKTQNVDIDQDLQSYLLSVAE